MLEACTAVLTLVSSRTDPGTADSRHPITKHFLLGKVLLACKIKTTLWQQRQKYEILGKWSFLKLIHCLG
ncbi:MAG: hypothetical protein ACM37W_00840 [Actinomycetota bacterium]